MYTLISLSFVKKIHDTLRFEYLWLGVVYLIESEYDVGTV